MKQVLVGMWGVGLLVCLCRWECKMGRSLQNSMAAPRKIKHGISVQSSISTSGYKLSCLNGRDWNRYLPANVHGLMIHQH